MTGWKITPGVEGYLTVEAELRQGGKRVASGLDKLFAVRLDVSGITDKGMIADTTGTLSNFMHTMGFQLPEYRKGTPSGDYLLVGAFRPQQWGSGISDIMEWVYKGHTLIIVDNPEEWAEYLSDKEVLDYRGSKILGKSWYGGNFFNRKHPIFEGLPQDCVFNWEYQCFATYNRRRLGLRCIRGDGDPPGIGNRSGQRSFSHRVRRASRGTEGQSAAHYDLAAGRGDQPRSFPDAGAVASRQSRPASAFAGIFAGKNVTLSPGNPGINH